MTYKNLWGAAAPSGQGLDQQRADLFQVTIILPPAVSGLAPGGAGGSSTGGTSVWDSQIQFALQKWPFPERKRETIGVKFLNQTNHLLGADTATGAIDIPVRYAAPGNVNKILEAWYNLTSNPFTGAVNLTSAVKKTGYFQWLVPDPVAQQAALTTGASAAVPFKVNETYKLEGVLITGLKPGNGGDMSATGEGALVMLDFSLQIDRYYLWGGPIS